MTCSLCCICIHIVAKSYALCTVPTQFFVVMTWKKCKVELQKRVLFINTCELVAIGCPTGWSVSLLTQVWSLHLAVKARNTRYAILISEFHSSQREQL